jgi:hypothetical protein
MEEEEFLEGSNKFFNPNRMLNEDSMIHSSEPSASKE